MSDQSKSTHVDPFVPEGRGLKTEQLTADVVIVGGGWPGYPPPSPPRAPVSA